MSDEKKTPDTSLLPTIDPELYARSLAKSWLALYALAVIVGAIGLCATDYWLLPILGRWALIEVGLIAITIALNLYLYYGIDLVYDRSRLRAIELVAVISLTTGVLDFCTLVRLDGATLAIRTLCATLCVAASAMALVARSRALRWNRARQERRVSAPESEAEIIELIKLARAEGLQVRVHGSRHSVHGAIATDAPDAINICLDYFDNIICWDDTTMQVTVQAGCRLGVDPRCIRSNPERSLLEQIDRAGWALPDLGGITAQSVGGFLSTASSGGSFHHSFSAAVKRIRFIDGTGQAQELSSSDSDDTAQNPFYGAVVSLGLFGIVTEVTLQCVPRFDIAGEHTTTTVEGCEIALFHQGEGDLTITLQRAAYFRLLWWPQHGVNRVQVWEGRRVSPNEPDNKDAGLLIQLPGGHPIQTLLGLLVAATNTRIGQDSSIDSLLRKCFRATLVLAMPIAKVCFRGTWQRVLPVDNEIDWDILPFSMSEAWIDIEQTTAVMQALQEYFSGDERLERTGSWALDISAAAASPYWLSPAYGGGKVRIDICIMDRGSANPREHSFPQFWELLAPFEPRYHWGKHIPPTINAQDAAVWHSRYPMLSHFLALRERYDPDRLFVTDYWRQHFAIPSSGKTHCL